MTVPRFYNGACPSGVSSIVVNSITQHLFPIGHIFEYPTSFELPQGALLCDGAVVSRETYAALFAVIGITYGAGDGSTTFQLPSLNSTDSTLVYLIQALSAMQTVPVTQRILFTLPAANSTSGDLLLQVADSEGGSLAGIYSISIRFVDSTADLSTASSAPPDTPGTAEFTRLTDDTGLATVAVAHASAATWFVVAEVGGQVFVSQAMVLGE